MRLGERHLYMKHFVNTFCAIKNVITGGENIVKKTSGLFVEMTHLQPLLNLQHLHLLVISPSHYFAYVLNDVTVILSQHGQFHAG